MCVLRHGGDDVMGLHHGVHPGARLGGEGGAAPETHIAPTAAAGTGPLAPQGAATGGMPEECERNDREKAQPRSDRKAVTWGAAAAGCTGVSFSGESAGKVG